VIVLPAATGENEASVAAYEDLRRRALVENGFGDLGQIFLVREGLVAWMARARTDLVSAKVTAVKDPVAAAPVLSDEIHAGVVRVLASMAMARRREMTT
jgi:hypothetical protein